MREASSPQIGIESERALIEAVRQTLRALGQPQVSVRGGAVHARFEALPGVERQSVARAVAARQREFATGRGYARQALRDLGIPNAVIPRGADGAPEWPDGVTGSISHGGGLCLAVASVVGPLRSIGIDVEPAVALEAALWPTICAAEEIEQFRALGDMSAGLRAAQIFSAKEAGYKAQYPVTRTFVEFDAATVQFDERDETFEIWMTPEVQQLIGSQRIRGALINAHGFVLTIAIV